MCFFLLLCHPGSIQILEREAIQVKCPGIQIGRFRYVHLPSEMRLWESLSEGADLMTLGGAEGCCIPIGSSRKSPLHYLFQDAQEKGAELGFVRITDKYELLRIALKNLTVSIKFKDLESNLLEWEPFLKVEAW